MLVSESFFPLSSSYLNRCCCCTPLQLSANHKKSSAADLAVEAYHSSKKHASVVKHSLTRNNIASAS